MEFSTDALAILNLIETYAFSRRIGIVNWEPAIEAVLELHRICHRPDTLAKDIAFRVRQLKDAVPENIFFELIGRDEELQIVKATFPNGEKITQRFAGDWSHLFSSRVDLDKSEYPPCSWPVWCNGKETVHVTSDCKVRIQKHGT